MIEILITDRDGEYAAVLGARLAAASTAFSVSVRAPAAGDAREKAAGDKAGRGARGERGARAEFDFVLADVVTAETARALAREGGAVFAMAEDGFEGGVGAGEKAAGEISRLPDGVLDRYGGVGALAARLKREYAIRNGRFPFSEDRSEGGLRFIACFGLSGGCGASAVAIGVGRALAAYADRRVLYLSLERVEADGLGLSRSEGDADMGDFLYTMLRERESDMRTFLDAGLCRDRYGLRRFYPSRGYNDLAETFEEDPTAFVEFIRESERFDFVILDLGSVPGKRVARAAGLCSALIAVENGGLPDAGRREKMTALMQECAGGEARPTVRVKNMLRRSYEYETEAAEGDEDFIESVTQALAEAEGCVEIGMDEVSFSVSDGGVDFGMSGEFGVCVSRIAEQIQKGRQSA